MKEYIIHGTKVENLIKILQDGYINNKPLKKDIIILQDKPSNQIFTQLVYKDIPNQSNQIVHWGTCAIVLDKQLLKDYPFYATRIGGFSDKFENGKTNEETIIYGDGNLTKMPILTKLKNITATASELNQLDDKVIGGTNNDDIVDVSSNQTLSGKTIESNTYT